MRATKQLWVPILVMLSPGTVFADPPPLGGTPPPDPAALVTAPKPVTVPTPTPSSSPDRMNVAIAAGGVLATGNSRLFAGTVNGKFEMRRGYNGFAAALMGNYGESAVPNSPLVTTTENLQGRVRYDRYFNDDLSVFLIGTGRHDRFQGLNFRLNVDPGVKYLALSTEMTTLWGELGYDFQYDIRRRDALEQLSAQGQPDPSLPLLPDTMTDQSGRVFLGFRRAFNKEVEFVTGLEYLQSFRSATRFDYRINYDALFAANVGAGFSVGIGFSARYDKFPLPGKQNLDTSTTLNLIYALSETAAPAAPAMCPCPPPAPAPP